MNSKTIITIVALIIVGTLFIISFGGSKYNNNYDISNFEECIAAGNPAMESYPRQCNDGENTYVEDISVRCTEDQRGAEFCTAIYQPVCAKVNIQCISEPCDPIRETFASPCVACSNNLVESYVPGECFIR